MKSVLFALTAAIVLAGCATQKPAPEVERTPEQQAADRELALKNGYRVTSRNGHPVYCKTWPVTTSRIQQRDICLTAQELDAQERHTRKDMETPNLSSPTPAFH